MEQKKATSFYIDYATTEKVIFYFSPREFQNQEFQNFAESYF